MAGLFDNPMALMQLGGTLMAAGSELPYGVSRGQVLGQGLQGFGQTMAQQRQMQMQQQMYDLKKRQIEAELARSAQQGQARQGLFGQIQDPNEAAFARAFPDQYASQRASSMFRPAAETFETVQNPYGRGGVGQRSKTSGKIVGYQAPSPKKGMSFTGRVARLPNGMEIPIVRDQTTEQDYAQRGNQRVPLSNLPPGTTYGTPQQPSASARTKAVEATGTAEDVDRLVDRAEKTLKGVSDPELGAVGGTRGALQSTAEVVGDAVGFFAPDVGERIKEQAYDVLNPSGQRNPAPQELALLEEDLLTAMISARRAAGKRITNTDVERLQKLVSLQGLGSADAVRQRVAGILSRMKDEAAALRTKAGRLTERPGGGEGPQIGTVEDGYRFMGGNPGNPNNWKKVGE